MNLIKSTQTLRFDIDNKTTVLLRSIYPALREHVLFVITQMWYKERMQLRVTEAYRSYADQEKLYNQGRLISGPKVTNAKPGLSYHNYGLAVDFCFRGQDPYLDNHRDKKKLWLYLSELIEQSGCYWGGNFKTPDMPHMELRINGFTPQYNLDFCKTNGLRSLWLDIDRTLERNPGEGYDLVPEWINERTS